MCCGCVIITAFCVAYRLAAADTSGDMKVLGTVYPTYVTARGRDGGNVLNINQDITLTLKQSEVLSDDFFLISHENGERRFHDVKPDAYNKRLYHDEEMRASVFVYSEDPVQVEGIVSDTLRIKPAHDMGSAEDFRIPHTLYEVTPRNGNPKTEEGFSYKRLRHPSAINFTQHLIAMRSAPNGGQDSSATVHPELHIVADNSLSKKFGFDASKIILYLCVLLNAVNLRYATITKIRIQLMIVGITVSRFEEKYIKKPDGDTNKVFATLTLEEFNTYYLNTLEFDSCDLLILFTGLDMVYMNNGNIDASVEGHAHIGGACQSNKVGMFEDLGLSFHSVYVVAHEIGHSLGCVHDGDSAEKDIPQHKGSEDCSWDDGYIMTYKLKNDNQYRFSQCCQDDMKNLIDQPKWKCLRERTPRQGIFRAGLPGKFAPGENYCKAISTTKPCLFNKGYGVRNCKIGCICGDKQYAVPALDGAPCDSRKNEHKHCQLGKCVAKKIKN